MMIRHITVVTKSKLVFFPGINFVGRPHDRRKTLTAAQVAPLIFNVKTAFCNP